MCRHLDKKRNFCKRKNQTPFRNSLDCSNAFVYLFCQRLHPVFCVMTPVNLSSGKSRDGKCMNELKNVFPELASGPRLSRLERPKLQWKPTKPSLGDISNQVAWATKSNSVQSFLLYHILYSSRWHWHMPTAHVSLTDQEKNIHKILMNLLSFAHRCHFFSSACCFSLLAVSSLRSTNHPGRSQRGLKLLKAN